MKTVPTWYFDFISPFAYLQWPKERALLDECEVALRPIVLTALHDPNVLADDEMRLMGRLPIVAARGG